jgi:hypothetical protein
VVGFLFCVLMTAPLAAQKKSDPELFNQFPFDQWVKQGPVEQIPWKTEAFDAGLSLHQRLIAHIDVAIKGKELARRNDKGDVVAMVQITDSSGHAYRDARKVEVGELKPGKHDTDLVIEWDAFVLPGDYTVVLAIHHTGAGERSLAQRTLHIRPMKNDPLPESARNLPSVEFLSQLEPPDPDVFYHSEIKGKLFLPITNRRPLQVEVMADITPSPLFHGSTIYYGRYLSAVLSTVKVLSQMQLQNGAMDVSTLNLVRHRSGFEQEKVGELDWQRLKKTVTAADTVTVDVSSLGKKPPSAAFLHDEILRRIENNKDEGGAMQVFVVISSPLSVYSFDKLNNQDLPQPCNCRIFYIEYDASRRHSIESATGQVEKMLRPVKVRSFREHSPEGLREAIAKMMGEAASF